MRRLAPRPAARAFEQVLRDLAPATTLARVQSAWGAVVGETIGAESKPVSEHDGTVTVACRSSVWAQELELMAPELVERINVALAGEGGRPAVGELRFRVRAEP